MTENEMSLDRVDLTKYAGALIWQSSGPNFFARPFTGGALLA